MNSDRQKYRSVEYFKNCDSGPETTFHKYNVGNVVLLSVLIKFQINVHFLPDISDIPRTPVILCQV